MALRGFANDSEGVIAAVLDNPVLNAIGDVGNAGRQFRWPLVVCIVRNSCTELRRHCPK